MPRTFRPAKKDINHAQIVQALRRCGWAVADTSSVGVKVNERAHTVNGALDMFCSKAGVTVLVEVKTGAAKLNEAEQMFFDNWQGDKCVAHDSEEAVNLCEGILATRIPF